MSLKSTQGGALGFFLVFGLFWTGIVGFFDGMTGWNIFRQLRAEEYPTVAGSIASSEVLSESDSDGTIYRAQVFFRYTVEGVRYVGERYRYGAMGTSDRSAQQAVVNRYPPGTAVTVHYDPDDPADAVLEVGVGGMDLFLLLFLTPFNLVMLWVWGFLLGAVRRKLFRAPAGGVPTRRRGMKTIVRLPRLSPYTAAGVAALVVSFPSIFILGFASKMSPSLPAIGATWAVVLLVAAGVYFWRSFVIGSGAKDLIIDREALVLSLPRTFGRKTDVLIPYAAISGLCVQRVVSQTSRGGSSTTYSPTIEWTTLSGATKKEKLADWMDQTRAAAFIQWLGDEIGVKRG